MISRNNGHTGPSAISSFWVKLASRDGVVSGSCDTIGALMDSSSGRRCVGGGKFSETRTTAMSETILSPRSVNEI